MCYRFYIDLFFKKRVKKEITDKGITLEEYLGKVPETAVPVDLGTSELYTEKDRRDAVKVIKTQFNTWEGCELHSVNYAGDEWMNEEKLQWMNELGKDKEYTECIAFTSDFHSPKENAGAFNPDYEYTNYEWWLARTEGGEWELLSSGSDVMIFAVGSRRVIRNLMKRPRFLRVTAC